MNLSADGQADIAGDALKVLLVDDDLVGRRLAGLLLKRLAAAPPVIVESSEDALRALQQDVYDLVLIDLDLCGADWLSAARAANIQAAAKPPWIVAMTIGDADDGGPLELRSGFDEMLNKPLSLQALTPVVLRARQRGAAITDDFNAAIWAEIVRLFKPSGAAELVDALIADLPVMRERYTVALQNGDLDALKRVAHSLRGSSLQLGADALAQLCAQAEQMAAAGERESATRLAAEVIERHAALVERLRREVDQGENAGGIEMGNAV